MSSSALGMRRIAFFFVGADRAGMLEAVREGRVPNSVLRGADFFTAHQDWEVDLISSHAFEAGLPRLVRALVPMPLLQLCLVPRLMRYDVVIASDAFVLGAVVSLLGRTKWLFVAINSSVLIRRHEKHPLRRALLRWCWHRCAAIVCLTDAQQRDLVHFGVRERLLSVIHFGVDTAYFAKASPSEGAYILSIGKDLGRDYATLLAAAEHTDTPLLIITSKKNIPHEAHIPSNVTLRYDVPLDELRALYAAARFVVVASLPDGTARGTDCSGQTVVLEALASGRAVLATERAWLDEYFTRGEEYLAAPAADAPALASAMGQLWVDAPLREHLAEQGARMVCEHYSSQRFAEALIALTERILA